jgi:hypothetical protein
VRLALPLEELVDNDARDPCDRETGETQEADEEEFESKKHVSILFLALAFSGNALFHSEEVGNREKHDGDRLDTKLKETRCAYG